MLGLQSRLRRRDEEVLAKIMDGEAVIINLANGTYYSAEGVGCLVWNRMDEGLAVQQIAAELEALYEVDAERARADVLAFANQVLREDLMSAVIAEDEDVAPPSATRAPTERLTYEPPQIHVYRDMEELLALDPPTPGLADLRWKG